MSVELGKVRRSRSPGTDLLWCVGAPCDVIRGYGCDVYLLMKACQRVPKSMRKVTVAARRGMGVRYGLLVMNVRSLEGVGCVEVAWR